VTLPAGPLSGPRARLVDSAIDAAVADLLGQHARLRHLAVTARSDGGVVHLGGAVDEPAELDLLRTVVGRLAGVHAVWSRVVVAGRAPVALDLGCGGYRQYPDSYGVDLHPTPEIAVRADLSATLPFRDASVDRVHVVHLLEHLVDFLPLVDECHRVLRPGGVLHVMAPWWRHVNAVADPTHVRLIDVQTIKGLCARAGSPRRWYPLHAGCDGASVFADLTPLGPDDPGPDPAHAARFFS
jgi:SAM-dependent methyltransferase